MPLLRNSTNIVPPEEVKLVGIELPEKEPNKVAVLSLPSYTFTTSLTASVLNVRKFKVMEFAPGGLINQEQLELFP